MLLRSTVLLAKLKPLKLHPTTGVRLSPKLGQHLTINPGIIDTMLEAADIKSTDTVLEIGCGTGNITMRLLELAKKVIAIEYDERFAQETRQRALAAGFKNLEVIVGDATQVSYPSFDVCVSNPPFNISSPLIFRLAAQQWRRSVLMLQKDYAERMVADPGDPHYTRLSINCGLFFRTERIMSVAGGSFFPQSSRPAMIVRLIPRYPRPQFDFQEWDAMMRFCFLQKKRCLNAIFSKKHILNLLEANYKTWCSLNNQIPTLQPFPDYVLSTIEDLRIDRMCSKKLLPSKLENLLNALHAKGVYFSSVASKSDNQPPPTAFGVLPHKINLEDLLSDIRIGIDDVEEESDREGGESDDEEEEVTFNGS